MSNTGYKKYKGVSIHNNQVRALQDIENLIGKFDLSQTIELSGFPRRFTLKNNKVGLNSVCSECGSGNLETDDINYWYCPDCGLNYTKG